MSEQAKQIKRERLYLFDTTLRDGQQTAGVDFSVEDKQRICEVLDRLGVDYIEGGYPGANPTDTTFFSQPHSFTNATLTAFGMTKRAGRSVENDPGLAMILSAQASAVCLVAKSWDYHVKVALEITEKENLQSIFESVAAIVQCGKEAMIDCEHFFDGYKANPEYALSCAKTAVDAGARWVVLCDTNGGTLPSEVFEIVQKITRHINGDQLGIHAHNDTENAVANSLAALEAGVRQIQGTLNGLGERCGNANIVSLIPTLLLKPTYANRFETGVSLENLAQLTKASHYLDELLNRTPNCHQPYVGESAFAHKGGIHVSAVMKDPKTYEHVAPQAVGNERKILVSAQAGRSNIMARLENANIEVNDPKAIDRILWEVKEKELGGYSYDNAGASFELLARQFMGGVPVFFEVVAYEVTVAGNGGDIEDSTSEARIILRIDGEEVTTIGQGNGPISALDSALRKDLRRYAPHLKGLRLTDYKVRILNTGTDAVTRVVIESEDENAQSWHTIGVSENVVTASFRALHDSIVYKLYLSGVSSDPDPPA